MARSPRAPSDGVATALGIHLCFYCAVAACFGFGLYVLLQPTRFANPGMAAYKPPPRTVVTFLPPLRLRNGGARTGSLEPTAAEPETTGVSLRPPDADRSVQSASQSEPETVTPPPSRRPSKRTPRRDVQPETTTATPQRSACIPSYDSSGAQTGAC
jgi:hypothetical protein